MQHALIALLVLLSGLRYPQQTMNARGERILIFGDSLTQHASGSQPVWNVDQGSQRQASGPGDLLASLLLEQGATVRTNALVSRSAINFWTREAAQNLIAADLAWRPTKIIFVLGTNDVGLAPGADEAAFIRLRDAYAPAKAEIWAIGPFKSRLAAADVGRTAAIMGRVFGRRFIDGRQLSALISNGPDGVHYEPTGARLLALNMADALLSASTVKPWVGLAIGLGVVIGGGMIYSAWKRPARAALRGSGGDTPPGAYRLIYLTAGKRSVLPDAFPSIEAATRAMRALKARGYTTWVEDDGGAFVPVKGAQRKPRELGFAGTDDDDPRSDEDDETWWQRITRKSAEGQQRVNRALSVHDALILTARGGRRILVIKSPEMSNRAEGTLRVTVFDEDGPIGHTTRRSVEQLAEEVYRDWHPETITAATDDEVMAWTGTQRFARGAAAVAEVQRKNRGLGAEYLPPGAYFLVDNAARAVPERERFGQRKVFISDVHAQLRRAGVDISPDDLKRELIRMHRDRNVHLARADLVAAMDPAKVAASEARDGNATFHFVVIE